jgi:uncharacterized membrane protein YfcA
MIGAIAIGLAGGIIAGLLGVGGGVLFVPGLVLFMKLGQHQAEATSLLAIVPVAIAGTIRQDRYGNVRRDDAVVMGALSLAGAIAGVALANALSGQALRVAFAILILFVAFELVRSTLRGGGGEDEPGVRGSDPVEGRARGDRAEPETGSRAGPNDRPGHTPPESP